MHGNETVNANLNNIYPSRNNNLISLKEQNYQTIIVSETLK